MGDGPVRSCILTRDRVSRAALVRLALAPDERVLPDVRAKAPGRGAWIGASLSDGSPARARSATERSAAMNWSRPARLSVSVGSTSIAPCTTSGKYMVIG